MKSIWIKRIATTLTLLSLAATAFGQYAWIDEKGGKQYSDMPPPASVPKNRILKQPGQSYYAPQNTSDSGGNADAKSPASADKASAPMTLAEKNAEFNKRKAKQAEQEAKAAEEAKNAANKAKNCDNARSYYRSLSSGERIATTDKNGERVYLSDDQRAKDMKDAQSVINDCK